MRVQDKYKGANEKVKYLLLYKLPYLGPVYPDEVYAGLEAWNIDIYFVGIVIAPE